MMTNSNSTRLAPLPDPMSPALKPANTPLPGDFAELVRTYLVVRDRAAEVAGLKSAIAGRSGPPSEPEAFGALCRAHHALDRTIRAIQEALLAHWPAGVANIRLDWAKVTRSYPNIGGPILTVTYPDGRP